MATENPTWVQTRVASDLSLKLGSYVCLRTARAYWPVEPEGRRKRSSSQRWHTFVRNHAQSLIACDFLVAVTVRFRVLYVLVIMEIGNTPWDKVRYRRFFACINDEPTGVPLE